MGVSFFSFKLYGGTNTGQTASGANISLGAANAQTSGQQNVVATHSITLNPGFYVTGGTFTATIEKPFLQTISYNYNERGWLRTANTNGNLFNLDLRYEAPDLNQSIVPQYNGNISEMLYNVTKSTSPGSRQFSYEYDALNRLTKAISTNNLLDEAITYDKMGNITALTRGGLRAVGLGYTYTDANGNYTNQLQAVQNNNAGFRTYGYDPNGNATSDGNVTNNKAIQYNLLNLPEGITANGATLATYTYSASGSKLRNTGNDGAWDYDNGIVYQNNIISFIQTEEGRATYKASDATYHYEYNLKDHLGNTRVSFDLDPSTNAARVIQEDEYYSFGLRQHGGYNFSNNNRYLYNGKEIQTDLTDQYDYGARFYDPVVARWTSADPLAEIDRRWSTYNYGEGNPIKNIDPDGMAVELGTINGDVYTGVDAQNVTLGLQIHNLQDGGKKKKDDPKERGRNKSFDSVPVWGEAGLASDALDNGDYLGVLLHEAIGFSELYLLAESGVGSLSETVAGWFVKRAPKTVWSSIVATQEVYAGTVLPKSFELTVQNGSKVWVHGNTTEHIAEYLEMLSERLTPDKVRLVTQQMLK